MDQKNARAGGEAEPRERGQEPDPAGSGRGLSAEELRGSPEPPLKLGIHRREQIKHSDLSWLLS